MLTKSKVSFTATVSLSVRSLRGIAARISLELSTARISEEARLSVGESSFFGLWLR